MRVDFFLKICYNIVTVLKIFLKKDVYMKETLSLLAISLAVLIVSVSSFKNISTTAIATADVAGLKTVEKNDESKQNDKLKDKNNKAKNKEKTSEQKEEAAEVTEQAPAEESAPAAEQSAAPEVQAAPAPVQQQAPAPQPAPAPAPQVNYSYANVSPYSSAADRLNCVSLSPQYTPNAELNNVICSILNQIISPYMSNYEKAKACYTYIIANCSDGYIYGSYSYKTGGWNVYAQALALFTEYRGMCDCYSAGFAVLARAVGFNCSQVEGNIPGYTDHDWCEINIGGVRYIFDPDVEEDRTHSGTEYYFCKTYSELSSYQYLRTIG